MSYSCSQSTTHPVSYREQHVHVRSTSKSSASFLLKSSSSSLKKVSIPPLDKPSKKQRINTLEIVAAVLSLIYLILAVKSVASESVSWRLGQGNNQLIVVGFLLSIMNLCLASVATKVFLILEAWFGSSKLQNYDGILRYHILASKLSITWRFILVIMLAPPIGLSVSYKRFTGGESVMHFNVTE